MDISSASSFYEPPVQYDEKKTIELYEKIKTDFKDIEGLLGGVQKNLLKVQKESTLTVKLIEKFRSVQSEPVDDQTENQDANQSRDQSRNQSRNTVKEKDKNPKRPKQSKTKNRKSK